MAKLSDRVIYTVPQAQQTSTLKGGVTLAGSTLHESMTQFAGVVTAALPDGRYDLMVWPPNKPGQTINDVAEGAVPGDFIVAGDPPPPS
jgi:hypothetical protein